MVEMDPLEQELAKLHERDMECLTAQFANLAKVRKNFEDFCARAFKEAEEWKKSCETANKKNKRSTKRNSRKENETLNIKHEERASSRTTRSRNVLHETQQLESQTTPAAVKQEKRSITNARKNKSNEEMPPPTLPLKKNIKTEQTRRPRTRARKALEERENTPSGERKDSDVIVTNSPVVTVHISDDDDERSEPVRASSRTRTKSKRDRSVSSETSSRPKRTRNKKPDEKPKESTASVYEDAAADNPEISSALECPIVEKTAVLDATYQVPTDVPVVASVNDLMTEDEDSPVREPQMKEVVVKVKQLFSPYLMSPVKKKVEAFEKLGEEQAAAAFDIPVKVTRTKTKKKEALGNEDKVNETRTALPKPKLDKSTTSSLTPFQNSRILPSAVSQSASKFQKNTSLEQAHPPKSYTSVKASQADYRERELRRQKEAEALKKREAALQAQIEEKRRKREEKQQKAQQQREDLERKKQEKLLMDERAKQEKVKQALAEKELKQNKLREEHERKRLLAKKKAVEEKQQQQPIYMVMKAPRLPTADCYDSDEEGAKPDASYVCPKWTKEDELLKYQKVMNILGEQLKNTLFCRAAQTPDLVEIFQKIDQKKLKRTSSAIWHQPPRFTLMPTLNSTVERNDSSDSD